MNLDELYLFIALIHEISPRSPLAQFLSGYESNIVDQALKDRFPSQFFINTGRYFSWNNPRLIYELEYLLNETQRDY